MICGKCKIILVSKSQLDLIEKIRNRNKKRTRALLFQSSEDGKQEKSLCGLFIGQRDLFLCFQLKVKLVFDKEPIKVENSDKTFQII